MKNWDIPPHALVPMLIGVFAAGLLAYVSSLSAPLDYEIFAINDWLARIMPIYFLVVGFFALGNIFYISREDDSQLFLRACLYNAAGFILALTTIISWYVF